MMEGLFNDYFSGKIKKDALSKKLSIILSSLIIGKDTKHFEVSIVNTKAKEPFFGARIFPIIDQLDDIVKDLVVDKITIKDLYKKWKTIDKWYIELDHAILDRSVISFTPQELVALILHEIGHVIYSEKPIEVFYRSYQELYMRMSVVDKASLKTLYRLYSIPLATACMGRTWLTGNTLKPEIYADSTLNASEYAEFLVSALGKIIREYGNSTQSGRSNNKEEVESLVKWSNLNICDLTKRQKKMKDELFYQTIKNDSGYMKALSFRILNTLGLKLRENYTGAVVEASINLICEDDFINTYSGNLCHSIMGSLENRINYAREGAMSEALEAVRRKKKNFPSRYDIDSIFVEVDRITNHHDRIYVLELIYNKIEELETFKELANVNSDIKRKYGDKIEPMLRDLDELRKAVLSKRKFENSYKLFVKVPEGYEG